MAKAKVEPPLDNYPYLKRLFQSVLCDIPPEARVISPYADSARTPENHCTDMKWGPWGQTEPQPMRGAEVRAPFDSWIAILSAGSGMVGLVGPNGIYIGLAHMNLAAGLTIGAPVKAGQLLGTVSNVHIGADPMTVHLRCEVGIWNANKPGPDKRDYSEPQRWTKANWDYLQGSTECPLPPWDYFGRDILDSFPILRLPRQRHDPLTLDLDGNGVQTLNVQAGAYFDRDGNGFAERTGWVDSGDGLLVMDRNGNGLIDDGKELFGNETILKDGTKAANGFQALAELDSNHDGKIDANDTAFSQLRVWKDFGRDGFSSADELFTLADLGITSINLDSTITNVFDAQGNTQNRVGSFERTNGTIGEIAEYDLQGSTADTIANEWLDVPEDIGARPQLLGNGNVYDLHQAMVRDTSGALRSLVEDFVTETNMISRNSLMDQILFKWTRSEGLDSKSRGPNIDARKLSVLEVFVGQSFIGMDGPNPTYDDSVLLSDSYHQAFEKVYAALMSQTHLKDLFDMVWCARCEETNSRAADMSVVMYELNNRLAADPEQGRLTLSEFARSVRGLEILDTGGYLAFREEFIQQDPTLDWVIDSGGLPVIEHVGQGMFPSPHMDGTDGAEAIRGSLTEADGFINGRGGNDVIYGTDLSETLINEAGDSLLVGGGGIDHLHDGAGNSIFDGGAGNDMLWGMAGNDTRIGGAGSDKLVGGLGSRE